MFNISVKTYAKVRFHKIMNIGFVVSCRSCGEQPFYDFRALGRPGQDFRAMGPLGLDFRALGHPRAARSITLQTLCSILRKKRMQHQVRFLKIMNIGFVESCCSRREQYFELAAAGAMYVFVKY